MSADEIFNWLEANHAQVWFDSRTGEWTCQVALGALHIQPSNKTLRGAIYAAKKKYDERNSGLDTGGGK